MYYIHTNIEKINETGKKTKDFKYRGSDLVSNYNYTITVHFKKDDFINERISEYTEINENELFSFLKEFLKANFNVELISFGRQTQGFFGNIYLACRCYKGGDN